MAYIISGQAKGAPAAIDTRRDTASEALLQVCDYLRSGMEGVNIVDGFENRIDGVDLMACCSGEKSLTANLKAI